MAAAVPPQFKPLLHYLKTAVEHQQRDPVVTYYCKLYALQAGMKIDKKASDCVKFLTSLMDELENIKREHGENEAISSEIVGQAHVENYALKVFLFADNEDRAGRFSKNVVKSFYTAGMLYDVLTNFGELSEEDEHRRKYAKWKAAYIHNCLKTGETPIAGPVGDLETSGGEDTTLGANASGSDGSVPPANQYQPPANQYQPPANQYQPPANQYQPPANPAATPSPVPSSVPDASAVAGQAQATGTGSLQLEDYKQAQKWCKFASSALEYQDGATAMGYLEKALHLLKTGS